MNLSQFKQHIESFPDGTAFSYNISKPFSWRGVYAEVAFDILDEPSTKESLLERIELAYEQEFEGYKGGEYRYNDFTDVHFEQDYGSYTDGGYCSQWISELTGEDQYASQEHRLANLLFKH